MIRTEGRWERPFLSFWLIYTQKLPPFSTRAIGLFRPSTTASASLLLTWSSVYPPHRFVPRLVRFGELNHRVKNMLAVVVAITQQTLARAACPTTLSDICECLLHLSIGNAPASQLAAPFSFARGVYSYRIRLRPSGTRSKPPALRGRTEVPRHAVRLRQVEVATLTISAERRRRAQSTPGTIRFSALSFPLAATLARHQVALLSAESGPRNDGQCESAALVDAI